MGYFQVQFQATSNDFFHKLWRQKKDIFLQMHNTILLHTIPLPLFKKKDLLLHHTPTPLIF